ncbi:PAS domain S-box protein [Parasphingorhabdus sp.]|uniref:PAS domain S-box protein n=1 Tax=Parasphingorhabdus sp. TaxID=2709688 RepID=UPI003001E0CC
MRDTNGFDPNRTSHLESVLSRLPNIVMIVDRDLQAINCSLAGLHMLGVSSIAELPKGAPASCVAPSHRSLFRESLEGMFDKTGSAEPFELLLELPGKPAIRVECTLAPLANAQDEIDAILLSFQDVTSLRTAENKLAQANSLLQSILTTIPDAMVVIDEAGLVSSFSATAEKMFGYEQEEIIGRNVKILMPMPYRDAHDNYISTYIRTGEKRIIGIGRTVVGCKKDGTNFPLQLEVGEARIGDERYFTGFMVDLTEKKQTEAEMQALQADLAHASRLSAVGTLASSLAHEINQPLTAIANYLSAARDMMDSDLEGNREYFLEALQESVTESLRAGTIVRRLREFVSRGEINRQALSIAQIVEDATVLGMIGAQEKGIECSIEIDVNSNHVFVDRVQIQQVMVNLMRNAIEAMAASEEKKLHIGVRSLDAHWIEIAVSDTGSGIDQELGERIFDPFASTKGEGMGLGLSICRTIIEAHGGTIRAEAHAGGGTTFRITLEKAGRIEEEAAEGPDYDQ